MTSKRIQKIQRILLFLLAIAGLLYVSIYVLYSSREGFQTPDPNCSVPPNCVGQTIQGRYAYLCSPITNVDINGNVESQTATGKDDALAFLPCVPLTSSVCYTDAYTLMNRVSGMSSFVCFDRPGAPVWDSNAGHYRPFDPIMDGDPLPDMETQTALGYCAAYNSGFKKNSQALSTMIATEKSLYNLGFSSITANIAALNTLKNTYCNSPTGNMATVCASNLASMTALSNILANDSKNSLSNVSTTIGNSRQSMSTVVYGILEPNFYNSGCMPSSAIIAYESARGL